MSRELHPPVLSLSLVKTELPTVIKNEAPESEIVEIGIDDILDSSESEEEIISDLKDIDIVYHPVSETSIKSEILESYHCESVETQVLEKAENSPLIKPENISQKKKTEDTSDENVTKGTGQAVVEIQGSHEHSNTLSNLETHEQFVLNSSKDLIGVGTSSRKAKHAKKTDFAQCYKTDEITSWVKDKEKIKVIKAPVIPVEAHEYTSLAKGKHVCNHCQHAFNTMSNLRKHIEKIHREVTTMYQCPYCPYKSKWKYHTIKNHIPKHKDTKDIQWFQHLCGKCDYKTYASTALKRHELTHLKPEEIQYFYCYHCSYKSKEKGNLKLHIFRKHFKYVKQGKWHHCDKCDYKTYLSTNLKNHKLSHLKPQEIQYLYCYHCSYKAKRKTDLKKHIFRHFKNDKKEKRHHCDKCDYKTYLSTNLKSHKLRHLKPEEIQYFYCYHCSYKTKHKGYLKTHIFIHFKKEQVKFDCYICNFVTPKRESIIKHIKKHSKVQNKSEINEGI